MLTRAIGDISRVLHFSIAISAKDRTGASSYRRRFWRQYELRCAPRESMRDGAALPNQLLFRSMQRHSIRTITCESSHTIVCFQCDNASISISFLMAYEFI